jgi:hypothetical protein
MVRTKKKTPSKNGRGAYVVFDLDLTLGCFQHTNPLCYLWGVETLRETTQSSISNRIITRLQNAIYWFAGAILKKQELLDLVLRKNIDVLMRPLLFLRSKGKVEGAIIYSNSSIRSSLQLADALLERK